MDGRWVAIVSTGLCKVVLPLRLHNDVNHLICHAESHLAHEPAFLAFTIVSKTCLRLLIRVFPDRWLT